MIDDFERTFDVEYWIDFAQRSRAFSTDPLRYVLRIGLLGGYRETWLTGRWVASYDPEVGCGAGWVLGTSNPREAASWGTVALAEAFRDGQSKVRPLRHDGMPNRPLTAFDISIEWILATESGVVCGRLS